MVSSGRKHPTEPSQALFPALGTLESDRAPDAALGELRLVEVPDVGHRTRLLQVGLRDPSIAQISSI